MSEQLSPAGGEGLNQAFHFFFFFFPSCFGFRCCAAQCQGDPGDGISELGSIPHHLLWETASYGGKNTGLEAEPAFSLVSVPQ